MNLSNKDHIKLREKLTLFEIFKRLSFKLSLRDAYYITFMIQYYEKLIADGKIKEGEYFHLTQKEIFNYSGISKNRQSDVISYQSNNDPKDQLLIVKRERIGIGIGLKNFYLLRFDNILTLTE